MNLMFVFGLLAAFVFGTYWLIRWADLTVTATQVLPGTNANLATTTAGVAITAGQALYIDSSGVAQLAKADTAAHAKCAGIATNNAAASQTVTYQTGGKFTIGAGAAPTVGTVYVVSRAVAGSLSPWADLQAGDFVTIVGVADTSSTITMPNAGPFATGIAHA